MFEHSSHQVQAASYQHGDMARVPQHVRDLSGLRRDPGIDEGSGRGRLQLLPPANPPEGADDAGEDQAVTLRAGRQMAVVVIHCSCCTQALPAALVLSAASQHVLCTPTGAVWSCREQQHRRSKTTCQRFQIRLGYQSNVV